VNDKGLSADITDNKIYDEALCSAVGGIIVDEEELNERPEFHKLGPEIIKPIQDELKSQAKRGETKTIAWILPSIERTVASILNKKWVDPDSFMSYHYTPCGFLGLTKPEISTQSVVFLSPLWIWQES
jgi:hypothetical protein